MREVAPHLSQTPPGEENLIPTGGSFSGLVAFDGDIRVDGELEGRVRARGILHLGSAARVRADIDVDELIVEGSLEGNVRARSRIVLGPTARVKGHLETPRLAVADGCRIEGRCSAGTPGAGDAESEPEARPPARA